MGQQTLANPVDVVDRYQTYFSKKMLVQVVNMLRMTEFAEMADLPKNAGATSMTFFRRRAADASQVQTLTEGTPINVFTEVTAEKVVVTLAQLGEATKISDIRRITEIFDWLNQSIDVMAEDCNLKCDGVVRNAIITDATYGLLSSNGRQERFAGVVNTLNSANDFGTLAGLSAANAKWTRAIGLAAATQLRVNKAPKIGGCYIGVVAPQIEHDVMQDKDAWLDVAKYSNATQLFNGEIGKIDGVRYVESTNPMIEAAVYGTENTGGDIYSTLYLGKGAYGLSKLAGTSSPNKPSVIINNQPDKSDPLNQFVTAGWKAYYAAVCLNKRFVVNVRSKSTFQ